MPTTSISHRPSLRKAPRQARSVETVRIIVEAAARILEEAGLGGFTTNAVAQRAGVSIGSLYQYFPRKEALIGALIIRETSLLIGDWEAAAAGSDAWAALLDMIASAVDHQLRRPVLARLLDVEEARLPFDGDRQRVVGRLRDMLADVLGRTDLDLDYDRNIATQDTLAIIKGIVDAAGEAGEVDRPLLVTRVRRAVFGYLNGAERP